MQDESSGDITNKDIGEETLDRLALALGINITPYSFHLNDMEMTRIEYVNIINRGPILSQMRTILSLGPNVILPVALPIITSFLGNSIPLYLPRNKTSNAGNSKLDCF